MCRALKTCEKAQIHTVIAIDIRKGPQTLADTLFLGNILTSLGYLYIN